MRYEPGSFKVHLSTARDVARSGDEGYGEYLIAEVGGAYELVCGIVEEVAYIEQQATKTVESLCAERDDLRAMLKRVEWSARIGGDHCPVCDRCGRDLKHDDDCELAALITKPPGSWRPQ